MIAALTGFFTGFSIILAIGAQNAFVLRQGLLRAHVFWLCLLCSVSDAILIVIGVAGFGAFVAALPWLPRAMSLAGAAFLIVYGALRFRAALHGGESLKAGASQPTLTKVLLAGAAFTWLNPHVYLDTLGIVGAVSTGYPEVADKIAFGLGAASASFVFFFALGYGARLLAPLLKKPRAWQIIEIVIGATMWAIALGLILSV